MAKSIKTRPDQRPKRFAPISHSDQDEEPNSPPQSRSLQFLNFLLIIGGLAGMAILAKLLFFRSFDYDELSHAHFAWLVSQGQVPYRDFAMNHFPFFWLAMSPVMHLLPQNSVGLFGLRVLSLLFNALFVTSLWKLISLGMESPQKRWTAVCLGVVTFSPPVNGFLIEFRPDALANALMFGALFWLCCSARKDWLTGAAGGFFIGAGMLINTKLLLFPLLFGTVILAFKFGEVKRHWVFALAIVLGGLLASSAAVLAAVAQHIQLHEAWRMVISYNASVENTGTFTSGLVSALTKHPLGLFYIAAGAAAGAWCIRKHWNFPTLPLVAVALFLVLDAVSTARPWKQYVASWFIMAAWIPSLFLPRLIAMTGLKLQTVIALCICIMAGAVFWNTSALDVNGNGIARATQDHLIDFACHRLPPDAYVCASFDLHPVFRRDAFFKTVFDVGNDGKDAFEPVMQKLESPPQNSRFTAAGYLADLQEHRPALLVLKGIYTDAQIEAANGYLAQHEAEYEEILVPDTQQRVLLLKGLGP